MEDGGNLIGSRKFDRLDGTAVTETDNDRPKLGSNARAAVTEVRQAVQETVKDVRQGVRDAVKDTVNAVTGLGNRRTKKRSRRSSGLDLQRLVRPADELRLHALQFR